MRVIVGSVSYRRPLLVSNVGQKSASYARSDLDLSSPERIGSAGISLVSSEVA